MTKILVSGGYGAGWSTWNDDEYRKFILTYQPFIDRIEAGDDITEKDKKKFLKELGKEFGGVFSASPKEGDGTKYFCMLGLDDGMYVAEVDGDFKIEEYDGSESITYRNNPDGWTSL